MPFEKYNSIISLHKEECDWILCGVVNITEKIDGSNTSIWVEEDGIHTGSRNQDITLWSFRWFNEYVKDHKWINELLDEHPDWHLYWEWCVKHSIHYNENAYQQWYMFDIMKEDWVPMEFYEVEKIAKQYWIKTPHNFWDFKNITIDEVKEFAWKSVLWERWEWVVIRNANFINQWWHRPYAKLVTDKFKETNSIVFGSNNKHSENYHEMYVVNKYCTIARIKKIMWKIRDATYWRDIDERDTSQLCSRVLYDIISEEWWDIFNKTPIINNRTLKWLINKKSAKMYKDILCWFESVANDVNDNTETNEWG